MSGLSSQFLMFMCSISVVLAEDAIKAALNDYKAKRAAKKM